MVHDCPGSLEACGDNTLPIKKETSRVERLQRAQWLRAAILGANDGLLSTTSLMMGVGAAKEDQWFMNCSGSDSNIYCIRFIWRPRGGCGQVLCEGLRGSCACGRVDFHGCYLRLLKPLDKITDEKMGQDALDDVHQKGTLIDRVAMLENRVLQLSLDMDEGSISRSSSSTAYATKEEKELPVDKCSLKSNGKGKRRRVHFKWIGWFAMKC
ncbi:ccc1 family [Artemisia annua]|uniref:Ccc1 family n=1 Tax=Artemisia annua TaxID=35608 RepID=A0A2U1QP39_ARTAN|nr:ccc1 family [Artemisia annua]